MVLIVVVIIAVILFVSRRRRNTVSNQTVNMVNETTPQSLFTRPNYGYNNLPGDVLMNPYAPPLRDERYLVNVPTNVGAVDTNYRQVGILTPLQKSNASKILALMGRPLFVNRDKWQYYSMSDQNNSVKLPLRRNGRSCTSEYGCDKLYNGETLYVEGYDEGFRVTIYENEPIRYIPYL